MKVVPIPVVGDSYSYLLVDEMTREAAVIDCVDALQTLRLAERMQANLKSIFVTHYHCDHNGGNVELLAHMPHLVVYGADTRIPEINHVCKNGEAFLLGSLYVTALCTACHTKGDACFYVFDPSTNERAMFTGDVLLVGGVGSFSESHVMDLYHVLYKVIANLNDSTKIYCGHENTESNLNFALTIEPENEHVQAKYRWCQGRAMTIPSTLGQEKQYNPFMRVHEPALHIATQCGNPFDVLARLRELKEINDRRKASLRSRLLLKGEWVEQEKGGNKA